MPSRSSRGENPTMSGESTISLDQAVDLTRTGDLWLFRGYSAADRTIRALTNAPVNHVGMAVVLDDLPPLMWHAELGRGPSSACHINGGRSSSTTAIPTWLTGALVRARIVRSAAEYPRKSHRSPVRVRSTAWSRLIVLSPLIVGFSPREDLEGIRTRRSCRRGRHRSHHRSRPAQALRAHTRRDQGPVAPTARGGSRHRDTGPRGALSRRPVSGTASPVRPGICGVPHAPGACRPPQIGASIYVRCLDG